LEPDTAHELLQRNRDVRALPRGRAHPV